MRKIILIKGLPGSGKTTFAKSVVREAIEPTVIMNPSFLKEMIHFDIQTKKDEELLSRTRDLMINELLLSGYNVIVDDINLDPIIEYNIHKRFSDIADIRIKDLTHVLVETCIDRNSARKQKVPTDLIIDLHEKYINGQR